MDNSIAVMVLAAGKGKRMNATDINKVVLPLGEKPMILHTVELLEGVGFKAIILVVGFAQESIRKVLLGKNVIFAEQKEQLGTADAVSSGLQHLPSGITDVLVIQGDDSAMYTKELLEKLVSQHQVSGSAVTFLTVKLENPSGLGRIVRDENKKLRSIVEEKDATEEERKIREVNPACYVFSLEFLKKYLPQVQKSPATGEYYLTSLIDTALQNGEKIETMEEDNVLWRGINTPAELEEAQKIYSTIK